MFYCLCLLLSCSRHLICSIWRTEGKESFAEDPFSKQTTMKANKLNYS